MRAVIQRVSRASLYINDKEFSAIGKGLVVLLGVEENDTQADADWLCKKITGMRIFSDETGLMNYDMKQAGGELMIVSQFTLFASCKKGSRPSFIRAAKPAEAIPLYEYFISITNAATGIQAATGQFGADMQVSLTNDGPVTILLDSREPE